jgi:hypothetical protein
MQTDGRMTDMAKLTVTFRNFENAPKITKFVDVMICNILRDLPFSRNQALKSTGD